MFYLRHQQYYLGVGKIILKSWTICWYKFNLGVIDDSSYYTLFIRNSPNVYFFNADKSIVNGNVDRIGLIYIIQYLRRTPLH